METLIEEMRLFMGEEVLVVIPSGYRVEGTLLDVASDYITVRSDTRMHRIAVAAILNFITVCQPEAGI